MEWDTEFYNLIPAGSRCVFLFILSAKVKMQKIASCIGAFFYKKVVSYNMSHFKAFQTLLIFFLCETVPSTSLQFHMSSPKHMLKTSSDPDFTNTKSQYVFVDVTF